MRAVCEDMSQLEQGRTTDEPPSVPLPLAPIEQLDDVIPLPSAHAADITAELAAVRTEPRHAAPDAESGAADDDSVAMPSTPRPKTRVALLWAYVLTIGQYGVTGLFFVWLASFITPSEFGEMALAMVWVTFAQMLAAYGPSQAVIQRPNVTDKHFNAAFWINVAIGVVCAAILVGAAPIWSSVNHDTRLTAICWALAPAIVLNAVVVVPEATLRRGLLFKRLSVRVLLAALLSGAVGVACAAIGFGVWSLVAQQLTQSLFSVIAVWAIAAWRPRLRFDKEAARDLRSFSVQSIAEFIAYFVATRTDVLLLGAVFGPLAIGLYRFSTRITGMISDIAAGGLGQISLPHLSRFYDDRHAFATAFRRMVHASALIAWPAFAILAISAHDLLSLVGPQWLPAVPALQVMCFDASVGMIGAILSPAILAAGRPGLIAAVGWIQAITSAVIVFAVGRAFITHTPGTQVLVIAGTFLVLRFLFMLGMILIAVRSVFQSTVRYLFGGAAPALLAALGALGAGALVQWLLPSGEAAILRAAITVIVAAGTAGAFLLWRDPFAREMLDRVLRRRPATT